MFLLMLVLIFIIGFIWYDVDTYGRVGTLSVCSILVALIYFCCVTVFINNNAIEKTDEVGRYDVIVDDGTYYYLSGDSDIIVPIPNNANTKVTKLSAVEKPYVVICKITRTVKNANEKFAVLSPFISTEGTTTSYTIYLPSE